MKEQVMLEKALDILSNPEDIDNAQINQECDCVNLLLSKRYGYPFKLNMVLKLGSRELFFQNITLPLLNTIKDLNTSQTKLVRLVKEKDVEIEAYKRLEPNMKISYHEKADKFDEHSYIKKHTKYEDYFGSSSISPSLLNKNIVTPEASITQKCSHKQEIKEEPASENLETNHFAGAEMNNIKEELESPKESKVDILIKADSDASVRRELEANTSSPRKKIKKLNLL